VLGNFRALFALGVLSLTSSALGQVATDLKDESVPRSTTQTRLLEARKPHGIHLDTESGTLIGIEGYAGLAVLAMSNTTRGHSVGGGILRARTGHFELGGVFEESDYSDGKSRTFGGFAGIFLPYVNWVDIDATVGFAFRRHENREKRYGAHGVKTTVPAFTLTLGISQRSNGGIFAARLGAALFAQIDLARKNEPWDYKIRDRVVTAGETSFGGTTLGMVMNLGFDLSFR